MRDSVLNVDWSGWTPRETGVLCFLFRGDEVLLIEKKRGLGAGKVNGPGGRIDPGETALQAAVRETEEEVGLTPLEPLEAGVLRFHFKDGYSLHCTVFTARNWTGEMIETPEAKPFWNRTAEIPFDRMWADDPFWIPHLLAGVPFEGWFEFEGDVMLCREVRVAG